MAARSFNTNSRRCTDSPPHQLECFRTPLTNALITNGSYNKTIWKAWQVLPAEVSELRQEWPDENNWNNPKRNVYCSSIWRNMKLKRALVATHRWKRSTPRVPYTQLYCSALGGDWDLPLSFSLWNSCMSLVACPITGFNPSHQQTKPPSAIKDPLVPLLQSECTYASQRPIN